jgi:alpha-L-rhamnosidase
MIERVGGIAVAPNAVAGDRVEIAPSVIGPVSWAKTTYRSPRSAVRCDWRVEDDELRLELDIPPGIKARVTVPTDEVAKVTESNVPAARAPGVTALPSTASAAVFAIGSGRYVFVAPFASQTDATSPAH